jgi:hypothetical protein
MSLASPVGYCGVYRYLAYDDGHGINTTVIGCGVPSEVFPKSCQHRLSIEDDISTSVIDRQTQPIERPCSGESSGLWTRSKRMTRSDYVRSGSKADFGSPQPDVRSAPESRHCQTGP